MGETAEPMESPEAVNAEQHQSAPVETDNEHGVEDDEFIIKTVMSFVEVNPEEIEMRFDANTHGGNLQFVDGRTVCKVEDDAPSICAFCASTRSVITSTADAAISGNCAKETVTRSDIARRTISKPAIRCG